MVKRVAATPAPQYTKAKKQTLKLLAAEKAARTTAWIAAARGIDAGSQTQTLQSLEKANLVQTDPAWGGREKQWLITEKGRELAAVLGR